MASKRRVRRHQCGNKQRHATHGEAVSHAISLRYAQSVNVRAYLCPFCGFFHVGRRRMGEDDR